MRVLRVIVDEMPKECNQECPFECDWQCRAHDWEQLYAEDFGKIPSWCPLEVETDGWIPVSERLPDENVRVMLAIKGASVIMGSHHNRAPQWTTIDGYYSDYAIVTHWRPLPEAPKEVKE